MDALSKVSSLYKGLLGRHWIYQKESKFHFKWNEIKKIYLKTLLDQIRIITHIQGLFVFQSETHFGSIRQIWPQTLSTVHKLIRMYMNLKEQGCQKFKFPRIGGFPVPAAGGTEALAAASTYISSFQPLLLVHTQPSKK